MKTSKNVIHRNVAGEHILIPVNDAAREHNGLFALTTTGAEVWDLLEQGKEPEEISRILSEDYGVDPDTVRADVDALIEKFKKMGLVED